MPAEPKRFRGLPPLRIGDNEIGTPVILAPMAGVSEAPFRVMACGYGAGLAPTELVSARGLQFGNSRTEGYLRHDPTLEPLLSVQIFGGDPEAMAIGAEYAVERGARMLDINMGCPVKKVTRNGAGSALMTEPARAGAIVRAMRERVGFKVPITAKIRAGWDDAHRNAPEVGRILEDAGLAAIAIHPRTRQQGYRGCADWSLIRALKDAIHIPVIANGDIASAEDAERVTQETGCDAVMIGRAALGNPWIFRELGAAHRGEAPPAPPSAEERTQTILGHLAEHVDHVGDEDRALKKFRQHLIWYSRGMRRGGEFRERVMRLVQRDAVEEAVQDFFLGAELTDEREAPQYDERTAFG